MAERIKTFNGITLARLKTWNGVAKARVKTWNGLDNTASASPSLFASNTNDDDYEASSTPYSQRINVTQNITIHSVILRMYAITSGDVYLDANTSYHNGGGSKIGSSSDTKTVTSTSTTNEVEFTWTSGNPVIASGDPLFIIVRNVSGAQRFRISTNAGGTDYEDTTYCMYGSNSTYGSGAYDFYFKLYVT